MRIVCLSDTHGLHGMLDVPDGDVLVHAGDFTQIGREEEVEDFARFLAALPHRTKIVVAGNHDFLFEREPGAARQMLAGVAHYLEDSGVEAEGLRFWGSPWQPEFGGWAFNLERGPALKERWAQVPEGVDVLVTHGPPANVLDRVFNGDCVGCEDLLSALPRISPKLHVFGHIHEARGAVERNGTLFVNASSVRPRAREVLPPVVVEWGERGPVLEGGATR
ncbi:MAG: metallophosphatase domain-containing protein [Planctomycetota bacterium]